MDKETVEKVVVWLNADAQLRSKFKSARQAWITKDMGISGMNQRKGAVRALEWILEHWDDGGD